MYLRNLNEPMPGTPVALVPPAARTANGSAPPLPVGESHTLRLNLAITAASGATPSLTVTIEHSEDGSGWVTHTAFAAATGPGTQRRVVSGLDRFVRCTWAITGTTPSFTFAVEGALI